MPISARDFSVRDLAPGETRSASLDLARFQIERVRCADDPLFELAYARLWEEFGAKGEMELPIALEGRFARAPLVRYEIVLVRENGQFAAVRDHTAIRAGEGIVVHLSHNLVAAEYRRTGLAGWMRALPLIAARECAEANGLVISTNGLAVGALVTLVAEMEYESADDPARGVRLRAYEKAGFLKVDPHRVDYHQPDFRAPAEIDAGGGPRPLPFQLVLRQVGREEEATISGARVRQIVSALYAIYGPQFRASDMAHPALQLVRYPPAEAQIALVKPTA